MKAAVFTLASPPPPLSADADSRAMDAYRTAEYSAPGWRYRHEPPNVDSTSGRRGGRIGIVDVTASGEGICAAQSARSIRAGLQPVPSRHPPFQFEFRNISSDTRGGCHRKSRACTVARLRAPDSDRSAASS